jgi:hypothetical protein
VLDKFCEDISFHALKQFSDAITAATQGDKMGLSPQDMDPELVEAWTLLQMKVQEIATNHGFPIASLGQGWIGVNLSRSPPTWLQIDTTVHWLNDHHEDLDTELVFVPPPPQSIIAILSNKPSNADHHSEIFKVYDYETHCRVRQLATLRS